jgi:hypothetical protein
MRSTVCIAFGPDEVVVHLPSGEPAWTMEDARRWLDEQFVAHECVPLRASGKVLTTDKLVGIAQAYGRLGFEKDEAVRLASAHAASAAVGRPFGRVDVDTCTVSY